MICGLRNAVLALQSYSLSRKVLTLTGRVSSFRAALVVDW
jgi:hypothetical protein